MDLFENEAVLDGGADAGAVADPGGASGVAEPGLPAEPAADTSAAAEPAAAPAWAPTQEDWQALTQTVQTLAQHAAPPPAQPAPAALGDYLQTDPQTGEQSFTPDGLERYINDRIAQGVDAKLSPVEPVLNQTIADRGEQLINQRLTELQTEVGPFDPKLARSVAEGLAVLPNADPNAVLKQAAEMVRDMQKTAGAAAVEEYKKTLSNVGNAQREPGANGAAVGRLEIAVGDPDRYKKVGDDWAARHGIAV